MAGKIVHLSIFF